jgi:mediator of RNA polymerase II transcription subunit 12
MDGAHSRYGTTPRRGGSRLKLELSNDSMLAQAATSESPLSMTPSRLMPTNESSDLGQPSPSSVARATPQDPDAPLPTPKRRHRVTTVPRPTPEPDAASTASTAKRDVRPRPYSIEVPNVAPKYKSPKAATSSAQVPRVTNSGFADFFPWTGRNHEDTFSETVIRNGLFDKASVSQSETGSAKLGVFPYMKQKSGLQALSSIFMGVLTQRRTIGQITSASTFKPPPRVTLTDTKRELWLKDLANPAMSLRKLSRTIPHGIRGKVLLEQCLKKNVPASRAVWLAKCVGANEIRAFKRKGVNGTFLMGGESKWIRDWTVYVEQFVESVASTFDSVDWKTKITYA